VRFGAWSADEVRRRKRPHLISAGPRQVWVWGSRTRPLPQPPTKSPDDVLGVDTLDVGDTVPVVTPLWKAGLV
jgi:hypothetical protein